MVKLRSLREGHSCLPSYSNVHQHHYLPRMNSNKSVLTSSCSICDDLRPRAVTGTSLKPVRMSICFKEQRGVTMDPVRDVEDELSPDRREAEHRNVCRASAIRQALAARSGEKAHPPKLKD